MKVIGHRTNIVALNVVNIKNNDITYKLHRPC